VTRQPFYKTLYGQVLAATVAGVALGYLYPAAGVAMKPLGDGFIKLVRMVIAPIIFCTVVAGVAGVGDMKAVGRAGGLALVYFEIVTTLALVIGLVVVNVVRPGAGMNVDPRRSIPVRSRSKSARRAHRARRTSARRHSRHGRRRLREGRYPASAAVLAPVWIRAAWARRAGAPRRFIDGLSRVLFAVVGIIMKTAPLGAFGAMAFTVGNFGVGTLAQLGLLMACFYATCVLFVAVVLNGIARLHGFSVWRFIKYQRGAVHRLRHVLV
jgi:aerobic C4-dicarboxylate transport protein